MLTKRISFALLALFACLYAETYAVYDISFNLGTGRVQKYTSIAFYSKPEVDAIVLRVENRIEKSENHHAILKRRVGEDHSPRIKKLEEQFEVRFQSLKEETRVAVDNIPQRLIGTEAARVVKQQVIAELTEENEQLRSELRELRAAVAEIKKQLDVR